MPLQTNSIPSIPSVGYLRLRQVLQLIPYGRSRWYQGVKAGEFPKPIKYNGAAFYKAADIAALIERIEQGA